ncbi:MAG TPA: hypothetical protein VGN37_13195 [Actinocatenispora sp.]
MALTEALAATAAQTMPVFALAAAVETNLHFRLHRQAFTEVKKQIPRMREEGASYSRAIMRLYKEFVIIGILLAIILGGLIVETKCIDALSGRSTSESDARLVGHAMLLSFLGIVIIPLITGFTLLNRTTFGLLFAQLGMFRHGRKSNPGHEEGGSDDSNPG